MNKVWAYLRLGMEFVERSVRWSVRRGVALARRADAWAWPRARAVASTFIAQSARALRWTAITVALIAAGVISTLERELPKAIDRMAAFRKEAAMLTLAALRSSAEFAKLHRPRAPAGHTRASRSWWYGVEAVEGTTAALRRKQQRLSAALRKLSQNPASIGLPSGPPRDAETDHQADAAAGEQHLAVIGPATSQSVMSSGARPSESSSSRISSR